MELRALFQKIETYHRELGYPRKGTTSMSVMMADFRNHVLAMHAELGELLDSAPWKPWREQKAEDIDRENILVELVDMLFFIGSIKEIFGISTLNFEVAFDEKLIENYRRIQDGYSKTEG